MINVPPISSSLLVSEVFLFLVPGHYSLHCHKYRELPFSISNFSIKKKKDHSILTTRLFIQKGQVWQEKRHFYKTYRNLLSSPG